MPTIATKELSTPNFRLRLGPATGSASDFWALGYCPEADEVERETNPQHLEFTYILRYQLPLRTVVDRIPNRVDAIWQKTDGTLLGVGDSLGYLEISPAGVTEVSLSGVPGIFSAIWGADDDNVFACGVAPAFAFYRHQGQWLQLALPEGAKDLRDACGFSARDVYFVGEDGQVHHFDGTKVTRLRMPVRRHLNSIVRLDETRVCIGGYQGTLLVGNKQGWRHLVTNVGDPLLSLAALDRKVYYGADEKVWCSDGTSPALPVIDFEARWLSGLQDGLVLSNELEAKLYTGGTLTNLDLIL